MLKTQQDENTALIKLAGDFNSLIEAMRTRFETFSASASQRFFARLLCQQRGGIF